MIKLTLFIDGMVPRVTKRINIPESSVRLPDARLIYENQQEFSTPVITT